MKEETRGLFRLSDYNIYMAWKKKFYVIKYILKV